MPFDENNPADALLDFHFDQLNESDRVQVERLLREDADLSARSARLETVLEPLEHWSVSAAPDGLVDSVLADIARERNATPGELRIPVEGGGHRRIPLFKLRDVLAAAACVALLVGVFVPGLSGLRQKSAQAMCANHMHSIFTGVSLYQQAYNGSLPYAGRVAGASWLPSPGSHRPFASNSRHMFLLVKGRFGPTTKDFVCAGCPDSDPMASDQVARCCDFTRACNTSYASMNLSGPTPNLQPKFPIAYLSDSNPLFVNARFDSSIDPAVTNSRAHGGKGQMVLTLDGNARWTTSPINSVNGDNLWLAGQIRRYTGIETPAQENDAHLVPGYPATDPMVQRARID